MALDPRDSVARNTGPNFEEHELEAIQLAAQTYVINETLEGLQDVKVRVAETLAGQLAVSLSALIYAERRGTIKVPVPHRETLTRERTLVVAKRTRKPFLRWLRDGGPWFEWTYETRTDVDTHVGVRSYDEVSVGAYDAFPRMEYKVPALGEPVRFLKVDYGG